MSTVKFSPILVPEKEQENWSIKEAGWYILVENRVREGPYSSVDTGHLTSYFNHKYDDSKSAQLIFMTPSIRPMKSTMVKQACQKECMILVQMMCSGWSMAQDVSGSYQLVPDWQDKVYMFKWWPESMKNFIIPGTKERIQLEVQGKRFDLPTNWQSLALSDLNLW